MTCPPSTLKIWPVRQEASSGSRNRHMPSLTMSARDYVGHLSTISAYLELPIWEQEQVYSLIMQVLPETVEIVADITVHLARRRSEQPCLGWQ
jgi:hypothetical protein